MRITTIATWIMIALIFWLVLYMIGGWILVGIVAGASIGGMSYFLWTERPK